MSLSQYNLYKDLSNANPHTIKFRMYLGNADGNDTYDRTEHVMAINITHEFSGSDELTSSISHATLTCENTSGYFTPDAGGEWWDVPISIWWGWIDPSKTYLGEFANWAAYSGSPSDTDYIHILSDTDGHDNWYRWKSSTSSWINICDCWFRGYVKEFSLSQDGMEVNLTCWDRSMKLQKTLITTTGNIDNGTDGNPPCTNNALKTIWDDANYPATADLLFVNSAGTQSAGTETVDASKVYTYYFDKISSWDEAKALAEADGGRLWWGKNGLNLHYIYGNWIDDYETNNVQTFYKNHLFTFASKKNNDIYNYIVVEGEALGVYDPATDRYKQTKWKMTDQYDDIFSVSDYIPIKAGETITFECDLAYPSNDIETIVPVIHYEAWTDIDVDGYPAGDNHDGSVVVTQQVDRPKRCTVSLINNFGSTLYVFYFKIRGKKFEQLENPSAIAEDSASIALYGKREFSMNNKYIRKRTQAYNMTQKLLDYKKDSRMSLDIEIEPVMGLDLWDKIAALHHDLPNRDLDGTLKFQTTLLSGRISTMSFDYSVGQKPRMQISLTRITGVTPT